MKTKLNSTLFALLDCATITFSSCKNETQSVSLMANPSAVGFADLRRNALADITLTKSFKAEDGITFETEKGTKVRISQNCLRDNTENLATGTFLKKVNEMY